MRSNSNKRDSENNLDFTVTADEMLEAAEKSKILGFWEWSYKTEKVHLTNRASRILGIDTNIIDHEELTGMLIENERPEIYDKIIAAVNGKLPFDFEIGIITDDSNEKWIRITASVIKSNNRIEKIYGLLLDITEQNRKKAEIKKLELRDKRTQAIAHLGSWEYIASDQSLIWSDETYRIFGKDPGIFVPTYKSFLEGVHPEDRDKVAKEFESSIETKENGYDIKHRIIHGITGKTRWVHERCYHHWNNNREKLINSFGMVHDLTKEVELTLKYENFYQAIENSANAIIITDVDGYITYANETFYRLYDYSMEEIIGENPRILNPGYEVYFDYGFKETEYRSLFKKMWKDIIDPKIGFWEGEVLNRTKTGELVRVQLYINAVKNETGNITSFIGYPIDISEKYFREKEIRFQTIMAIAELADKRDNETGQHMKRIGDYTYFMAREMGFPRKFCDDIKIFSPLHDIGKVGISDNILLAERKLTDDEFEIMKTHTTIGYQILKDRPTMEMAADIAHYHQEKYDGSGYPNGIKNRTIPISARLTTLADVYDALRSKRPYKNPINHVETCKIINEGKGRHFDPDLVDLFEANNHVFENIFESESD